MIIKHTLNDRINSMPELKTKSIQEILHVVQSEIAELDRRLLEDICPSSRALSSILEEIFKAGGKRLRPALSFIFTKAFNHKISEPIYLIAEISELIHTASLVHDDIIDNSLIRRGKPTANQRWNNAVTVISGDFMFARAAVNLGKIAINDITALYAKVLEDLCDGEIRQVEKKFSTEIDWDYYYSKTYKKTASLFEASAKAPAIALALSPEQILASANYGKYLGLAFQIIDDILDYNSDAETLGKPVLADLREGHITIPILFTLQKLANENLQAYRELSSQIQSLADSTNDEVLILKILETIKINRGIEQSLARAEELIKQAIQELDILPNSIYKQALIDLAEFTLVRNK